MVNDFFFKISLDFFISSSFKMLSRYKDGMDSNGGNNIIFSFVLYSNLFEIINHKITYVLASGPNHGTTPETIHSLNLAQS